MTSFLNFVLNVPLWAWIIIAIIVVAIIINVIESIITRKHIDVVYRTVRPLDSHLRDYNCNHRDILLRIERRCDKIDQRTQAHFAKKPKPKTTTSTKAAATKKDDYDDHKPQRNNRTGYKKTYRRIEYDK